LKINMKILLLVTCFLFFFAEGKYLRVKRDVVYNDACGTLMDSKIPVCVERIQNKFMASIDAGPDGKEDWQTRMLCNFVTDFMEDCVGEFEGTVCDEGDITKLKDFNMPTLVTKEVLDSWNLDESFYEKCPVVKEHKERMKDKAYAEELNVWIDALAKAEEEGQLVDDVAGFEENVGVVVTKAPSLAGAESNTGVVVIPSNIYFFIALIIISKFSF